MSIKISRPQFALLCMLLANTAYGAGTIPIKGGLTGCRFYVPQDAAAEAQTGRIYYDREALSTDGNWLMRRDQNTKAMPFMFSIIKVGEEGTFDQFVLMQEGTDNRCFSSAPSPIKAIRPFTLLPRPGGCEAAPEWHVRWSSTTNSRGKFEDYYDEASKRASRSLYRDLGQRTLWNRSAGPSSPAFVPTLDTLAMLSNGRLGIIAQDPSPLPGLECSGVRTPGDAQVPVNGVEPGESVFLRQLLPEIANARPKLQYSSVLDSPMRQLFNRALSTFPEVPYKIQSMAIMYGVRANSPASTRIDEAATRTVQLWQGNDELRPALEQFGQANASAIQKMAASLISSKPQQALDSRLKAQYPAALGGSPCNVVGIDQSYCQKDELRRRNLLEVPDNSNAKDSPEGAPIWSPSAGLGFQAGTNFQARVLSIPKNFTNNFGGSLQNISSPGLNLRVTWPYKQWMGATNIWSKSSVSGGFIAENFILSAEITGPASFTNLFGWTQQQADRVWGNVFDKAISSGLEVHFYFNKTGLMAVETNLILIDLNLKTVALEAVKDFAAKYASTRAVYDRFGLIWGVDGRSPTIAWCRAVVAASRSICRLSAAYQSRVHVAGVSDLVVQLSAPAETSRLNALSEEMRTLAANIAAEQGVAGLVAAANDPEIGAALTQGLTPNGDRTWWQYSTQPLHWFGESFVPIAELSWRTRWKIGSVVPVFTSLDFALLNQNRMNLAKGFKSDTGEYIDAHIRMVESAVFRTYAHLDWDYMNANVFNPPDGALTNLTGLPTGR